MGWEGEGESEEGGAEFVELYVRAFFVPDIISGYVRSVMSTGRWETLTLAVLLLFCCRLSFSTGPTGCIGFKFALTEMSASASFSFTLSHHTSSSPPSFLSSRHLIPLPLDLITIKNSSSPPSCPSSSSNRPKHPSSGTSRSHKRHMWRRRTGRG